MGGDFLVGRFVVPVEDWVRLCFLGYGTLLIIPR